MKTEGKKLVLTVLGKLANMENEMEKSKKGPFCVGFFYQPKRPNKRK